MKLNLLQRGKLAAAAEAEAFFVSVSVETKPAAEPEPFFSSDSVAAELFLISEIVENYMQSAREVYSIRYF
jgi:hypothetical protein